MAEKKAAGKKATGKKAAAKRTKKTKDVVIHLPDTKELAAAKMSQAEIEKMVKDMAGEKGSLKAASFRTSIPAVAVKGGARVARAFAAPGAPGDPNGWIKTIWRRFC